MCGSSVVGAAMAGCGAGDSQPAGCHVGNRGLSGVLRVPRGAEKSVLVRCEDSIGCMHGSSEPDLRNWKSPPPQFTQGARPDEHP
ncbi:hypothetical protein CXD84_18250 [Bordetella pertussis]|nr:hypothetical protein CXD84_18250 [Bordetella pertussis]QBS85680.1 hypothetical protein C3E18_18270 [Bordetella pertussis]